MHNVRTRIAPSPTGFPHIGTIYQVLFDFAYARKYQGKFILRIEDTDRTRFVEGAEEVIFRSLDWFGLTPDEGPLQGGPFGPYRQSERLSTYQKYALELVEKGHAYYCFCTKERLEEMRKEQEKNHQSPMYDRTCRKLTESEVKEKRAADLPYVIRMKVPDNQTVVLHDLIMGDIEFESNTIDDQVILKSDGFPTYHLGVVVDDHLMEISHVFRGREWVSSTPKHVLLYEFFGWEMPVHAHLPLILNSDGKGKLSKRHGHASVDYYREGGYLPEAVLNYLSNIVWNHPEGKEIYSFDEFVTLFDITQITSQGARFDLQKLTWMNQQYIQNMDDDILLQKISDFYPGRQIDDAIIRKLLPLLKTRMETLKDFDTLTGFFFAAPAISPRDQLEKEIILDLRSVLEDLGKWNEQEILVALKTVLEKHSARMPTLYYLFTGKEKGLPLPQSLEILGKEKILERLRLLS
ncbi:MAG TPA: glutamate--tRNA ligase [Patescibacteria group bacterium]|nr:glutamate--tRNA ligase [Patescibacteria group bacterium]